MRLILASGSPRRRELLAAAVDFLENERVGGG
jgi:predicted house-cleaning NTP pyrophosphatase (Maf/HAM1 superfamily)